MDSEKEKFELVLDWFRDVIVNGAGFIEDVKSRYIKILEERDRLKEENALLRREFIAADAGRDAGQVRKSPVLSAEEECAKLNAAPPAFYVNALRQLREFRRRNGVRTLSDTNRILVYNGKQIWKDDSSLSRLMRGYCYVKCGQLRFTLGGEKARQLNVVLSEKMGELPLENS